MSRTRQAQAFSLQAIPQEDGIHLVLPASLAKLLTGASKPTVNEAIPVFGAVTGHTIQISYRQLDISIPAMALIPQAFVKDVTTHDKNNSGG